LLQDVKPNVSAMDAVAARRKERTLFAVSIGYRRGWMQNLSMWPPRIAFGHD
jgi:hypothetical protein